MLFGILECHLFGEFFSEVRLAVWSSSSIAIQSSYGLALAC
jgi:hypothetical protein